MEVTADNRAFVTVIHSGRVACDGNKRKHAFRSEGPTTRGRLGDVSIYDGIILKRILKKWDVKL